VVCARAKYFVDGKIADLAEGVGKEGFEQEEPHATDRTGIVCSQVNVRNAFKAGLL
jgi:hypothetical protein